MVDVAGRSYTRDDVLGTLGNAGEWWHQLTDGRDPAAVATLQPLADRLAAALGSLAGPDPAWGDLDTLAVAARTAVAKAPWDDDTKAGTSAAMAEVVGSLDEAAGLLRSAGALPVRASGWVAHLHRSDGGVPKTPVDAVDIDLGGVVGDRQATRRHHGRPWQALCLWSAEVIAHLAAEGHPIEHGFAGENVTVSGLDWSTIRSGVRLLLGSDVLAQVSLFALPCASNAAWFVDREFLRMHHDRGPVSRVYATVLQAGRVRVGDTVVLEP